MLLFLHGKKLHVFCGLLKLFRSTFLCVHTWRYTNISEILAGNRKSFSGNEGKDVKQRKFFSTNKKQHTVFGGENFAK